MMHFPDDWSPESSGGYFPHLMYLRHTPCGFRSGMAYDLSTVTGPFNKTDAWGLIAAHSCGEGCER